MSDAKSWLNPRNWLEPATIISMVSLIVSGVSIWLSISANTNQKNSSDIQAITLLSAQSEVLQKHFKEAGIDDIPKLTNFLHLLGRNKNANTIPFDFYQAQIREWCPITRQAKDKLKIAWIDDRRFRETYQGSQWFLTMLEKLAGASPYEKEGCI